MKKLVVCTLVLFFLFCGTYAFANSMGFEDIVIGEFDLSDNFSFDVVKGDSGNTVKFIFTNNGPEDALIGGVFWDFGTFEDFLEVPISGAFDAEDSSDGLDFSEQKNQQNKNLPQGTNLNDPFSTSYSAFAKNAKMGIDPGQSAAFVFNIVGSDFDQVLAEVGSGVVRTAIHVQGVEGDYDEDSDTYIASVTPVPESAMMLLLGAGLIGIAGLGRKKLFKKK